MEDGNLFVKTSGGSMAVQLRCVGNLVTMDPYRHLE